jgi:uncharacterized membrane protein
LLELEIWILQERGIRRIVPASRGVLIVLSAGAVALIFIGPLISYYYLQILHPDPTRFVAITGRDVVRGLISVRGVAGMCGVAWLIWKGSSLLVGSNERVLLLSWGVVSVALLLYGLGAQALETQGTFIPTIVPSFHFVLYLQGMLALVGGIFLGALPWRSKSLCIGFSLLLAVVSLPWYFKRYDRIQLPEMSRSIEAKHNYLAMREWFLHNSAAEETVLAAPETAIYFVASAGRKVVVLPTYFSNPYVNYENRVEDLNQMYVSLRLGETDRFKKVATIYRVRYVVVDLNEVDPCCTIEREPVDLPLAFSAGSLRVYRVDKPVL